MVDCNTEKANSPERTCVGCRQKRLQKDMIRIARSQDGEFRVDTGGIRNEGRGCYLCPDVTCLDAGKKRRVFSRALGRDLPVNTESIIRDMISGK